MSKERAIGELLGLALSSHEKRKARVAAEMANTPKPTFEDLKRWGRMMLP